MSEATNAGLSRRTFLKGLVGAGGLVLGLRWGSEAVCRAQEDASEEFAPNLWLSVAASGAVTIWAHRSEMGTGIRTALPMVVADELEADWGRVRIRQALGDERYGSQNTDGSRSVRRFFETMRVAGATARHLLEAAAAQRWGVDPGACRAELHEVVHAESGRRLGFGELAGAAAQLPVPEPETLRFKDPSEWRYIGVGVPAYDQAALVRGEGTFGADVRLPGMKFAVIARSPVLGAAPEAFDREAALAVPGVEQVVVLPTFQPPHAFQALGGVAVIARDTWSALRGRAALNVQWSASPHDGFDSTAYEAALWETVRQPCRPVRDDGDAVGVLAAADEVIAAEYYVPFNAHQSMEPPVATARLVEGGCEVWAPHQNPQAAQQEVARALGLEVADVDVHVTLLGGGFGRKSKADFVAEAALLARAAEAPVQVVWTREDDIRHDYYHAVAALRLEATLGEDGRPVALLERSAFPTITSTFAPGANQGSALELGLGALELPYRIPNLRVENGPAEAHVRIGWLRSVCHIFHAFAQCSFLDELAHAAGRDPLAYLLELLGEPRHFVPECVGMEYHNHGEPLERYPIDTRRLSAVLRRAGEEAGWGRELPAGHGLGVAVQRSFLSYLAIVVEVDCSVPGQLTIPRVDAVLDCGTVVHPERVIAQVEGAVVFGVNVALKGGVTAAEGAITQSNFHDAPLLRFHEAPKAIHVHLVDSDALPSGVGEVGVPPMAPALTNAIFAATGERHRRLPVRLG